MHRMALTKPLVSVRYGPSLQKHTLNGLSPFASLFVCQNLHWEARTQPVPRLNLKAAYMALLPLVRGLLFRLLFPCQSLLVI